MLRTFLLMQGLGCPHPGYSQGGTWTAPKPYMSKTLVKFFSFTPAPGDRTSDLPSVTHLRVEVLTTMPTWTGSIIRILYPDSKSRTTSGKLDITAMVYGAIITIITLQASFIPSEARFLLGVPIELMWLLPIVLNLRSALPELH